MSDHETVSIQHDTAEILANQDRQASWFKLFAIGGLTIGIWVGTIEVRQHNVTAAQDRAEKAIEAIRHRADADRSLLIEMRNDIRWIREAQEQERKRQDQ